MGEFSRLVSTCNSDLAPGILSPYTITLGDEFQGIAKSLWWGLKAVFHLEETILQLGIGLKIRYVLHHGAIDTELNPKVAHGMLGPGLTKARELLNAKRRQRPRFLVDLPDRVVARRLCQLFSVLETLIGEWKQVDYPLISSMLANENNEEVGAKHGKNRSQIWKRRKHLHIGEFNSLKDVILGFAEEG